MRTVLLIRHGEVEDGAHCFIGHTDAPMSEDGEAEIRVLAQRLERVRLDAVYCSDLNRSRLTATLLAEGRAIPVRVQPELREINLGAWEGLPRREVAERQPGGVRRARARHRELPAARRGKLRRPRGARAALLGERYRGQRAWHHRHHSSCWGQSRDPLSCARHAAEQPVPARPMSRLRGCHRVAPGRTGRSPPRRHRLVIVTAGDGLVLHKPPDAEDAALCARPHAISDVRRPIARRAAPLDRLLRLQACDGATAQDR